MWKDMVERERKGHSATVEDFAPGLTSWLQRNRQYFMILLATVVFAVLLGKHTGPFHPPSEYIIISRVSAAQQPLLLLENSSRDHSILRCARAVKLICG